MNLAYTPQMAKGVEQWKGGKYTTITFCVTEDCNLACDYCYMTGKNSNRVMSFDTAKKIVDFALNMDYNFLDDYVAWDFIGGEPLLEMELINKISDYIVAKSYSMNHPWFYKHNFSFSTNGVLYGKPVIREYIQKHLGHCWFSLSVDGTEQKHNRARRYKNGKGSYADVVKNVPLWLAEFPHASTKATFSHGDLPYLKDSIIHLWNLGIKQVMANLIFEDVWEEGDTQIFLEQLTMLADYTINNKLWDTYYVSFFDPHSGLPVSASEMHRSRCGAGKKMMAFDCEGYIYPCIRFLEMCFSKQEDKINELTIGHIDTGLNLDRMRSFASLDWISQSPDKCNDCLYGSNCGWCEAHNLQDGGSIFQRMTYLCEMNKINAIATDYFWKRYAKATGKTSPRAVIKSQKADITVLRYVHILTETNIAHCCYKVKNGTIETMPIDVLEEGLRYCADNFLIPVFIGNAEHNLTRENNVYYEIKNTQTNAFVLCDIEVFYPDTVKQTPCSIANYITNKSKLPVLCDDLSLLIQTKKRVNLFIDDIMLWDEGDLTIYKAALSGIVNGIADVWAKTGRINLNILSDAINLKNNRDCGAGVSTITLAPNGKFYICPGFYHYNPLSDAGDLINGVNEGKLRLCKRQYSYSCRTCSAVSCTRCLLTNKMKTGELNIPPKIECLIQQINNEAAADLLEKLKSPGFAPNDNPSVSTLVYNDPIERDFFV